MGILVGDKNKGRTLVLDGKIISESEYRKLYDNNMIGSVSDNGIVTLRNLPEVDIKAYPDFAAYTKRNQSRNIGYVTEAAMDILDTPLNLGVELTRPIFGRDSDFSRVLPRGNQRALGMEEREGRSFSDVIGFGIEGDDGLIHGRNTFEKIGNAGMEIIGGVLTANPKGILKRLPKVGKHIKLNPNLVRNEMIRMPSGRLVDSRKLIKISDDVVIKKVVNTKKGFGKHGKFDYDKFIKKTNKYLADEGEKLGLDLKISKDYIELNPQKSEIGFGTHVNGEEVGIMQYDMYHGSLSEPIANQLSEKAIKSHSNSAGFNLTPNDAKKFVPNKWLRNMNMPTYKLTKNYSRELSRDLISKDEYLKKMSKYKGVGHAFSKATNKAIKDITGDSFYSSFGEHSFSGNISYNRYLKEGKAKEVIKGFYKNDNFVKLLGALGIDIYMENN